MIHMFEENRNAWASSVCFFLYKYGFDDVWLNQGVGNERVFISFLKERLISSFKNEWKSRLTNTNAPSLSLYRLLKAEIQLSAYLPGVKSIQGRCQITRVRLGVSYLKPHWNRFVVNPSMADLACPFCIDIVESEIHFILTCPVYNDLRELYINEKYSRRPSLFRLAVLLASEDMCTLVNLGKYLQKAFSRRSVLLS